MSEEEFLNICENLRRYNSLSPIGMRIERIVREKLRRDNEKAAVALDTVNS